AALAPLQPHRGAAAEGGRARALVRDGADLVDEPDQRRVEAGAAGDGLALPVHRPDGVPRAPPRPRRLPPARLSRPPPAARPQGPGRRGHGPQRSAARAVGSLSAYRSRSSSIGGRRSVRSTSAAAAITVPATSAATPSR